MVSQRRSRKPVGLESTPFSSLQMAVLGKNLVGRFRMFHSALFDEVFAFPAPWLGGVERLRTFSILREMHQRIT